MIMYLSNTAMAGSGFDDLQLRDILLELCVCVRAAVLQVSYTYVAATVQVLRNPSHVPPLA